MKIQPIAADSLGTRSMATAVTTRDIKILIDPSTAMASDRYGLEPHPEEIKRWQEHWQNILEYAEPAEVVIVTHYHYDHHSPEHLSVYRNKVVIIKDPENKINPNQKRRAAQLIAKIKDVAKSIEVGDGRKFSSGKTRIEFSPPVFHGKSDKLGYVIQVVIEDEMKFLFTSDIQGPIHNDQLEFILKENPEIVYLDGPLTYMLGSVYKKSDLATALINIEKILAGSNLKKLIIDHHLTRDINWQEKLRKIFDQNENRGKISTAAGFLGKTDEPLEARRKILYNLSGAN